jgi:hypothetical protein
LQIWGQLHLLLHSNRLARTELNTASKAVQVSPVGPNILISALYIQQRCKLGCIVRLTCLDLPDGLPRTGGAIVAKDILGGLRVLPEQAEWVLPRKGGLPEATTNFS